MNNIIYPNFEFTEGYDSITILTYLRKKANDNKYYKIFFCKTISKKIYNDLEHSKYVLLNWLNQEIYNFIICGIIDIKSNFKTLDGKDIFILDENQYEEEDRIWALCNYLPIEVILARKKKEEDKRTNFYDSKI